MRLTLDPSLEYGVVLEGGGARGAYQIGALKAVTEAGIRIGAVAGASVGALNGAFLCMGDLKAAEELWGNLAYSQILNVEDETIRAIKTLGLKAPRSPSSWQRPGRWFPAGGLISPPLKSSWRNTWMRKRSEAPPVIFMSPLFRSRTGGRWSLT